MNTKVDNSKFSNIPSKETKEILHKKIRDFYALEYSYEEICRMLNVSKTTVFLAVKGRARKSTKKLKPKIT